MKNIINFILKIFFKFLAKYNTFSFLALFLNVIKLLSVKVNILISSVITIEIKEEYKICGKLYIILKEPPSVFILPIVSSVKNNALTKKKVAKLKKNKYIFIILELKSKFGKNENNNK